MEEVRQSQAPQLGLVTDRERSERVERVKAFALRFVETCADKVSLTARPSLTLSLLKMQLTVREPRRCVRRLAEAPSAARAAAHQPL
jgi:hypothetical protein